MTGKYPFELKEDLSTDKGAHYVVESTIQCIEDLCIYPYMSFVTKYIVVISDERREQFCFKFINKNGVCCNIERGYWSNDRVSDTTNRLIKELVTYIEETCQVEFPYYIGFNKEV